MVEQEAQKISEWIAQAEASHPFLKHSKKAVSAILMTHLRSPCYLPKKATPITSVRTYLTSVIDPKIQVEREDVVFALVAIQANIGLLARRSRTEFKVFPESGINDPDWRTFQVSSREDADKLLFAMADVQEPTQTQKAHAQSCANRLINRYELYNKAMNLFRYREQNPGSSFAQAKQAYGLSDREYTMCLKILGELGLVEQRQVVRLSTNVLAKDNVDWIEGLAKVRGKSPSQMLNIILEECRKREQGTQSGTHAPAKSKPKKQGGKS